MGNNSLKQFQTEKSEGVHQIFISLSFSFEMSSNTYSQLSMGYSALGCVSRKRLGTTALGYFTIEEDF